MNYQFANLLGAPYRGGSLLLHNNELLSPVGNRVSQVSTPTAQQRSPALAIDPHSLPLLDKPSDP
jgi:hypothetical protein